MRHNGKPIDIVAQAGKTGFLYVFERKTGKPLWPIEERPVPKSDVPGEFSSPTQPFPTKPPPFARQSMTPDEVNPFVSAEEQEKLRQLVREAATKGCSRRRAICASHPVPGRVGRRELGQHGRRSGDRHALRAQPRDDQLSQDVAGRARERRRGGGRGSRAAQREQEGQNVYMQRCSACHGPGQMPMRSLKMTWRRMASALDRAQGHEPDAAVSARRRSRTTRSTRSSRI